MKLTYWTCEALTESSMNIYSKTKRGAQLEREANPNPGEFLPVAKKTVIYSDAFDLLTRALKGEIT